MRKPVLIGGYRGLEPRHGADRPVGRNIAERESRKDRRAKLCVWTIPQAWVPSDEDRLELIRVIRKVNE